MLIYPALSVVSGWLLSFSYILLLVGSFFLSPFRLLCYIRNYETIAGGFNPERVPCYPCDCEKITTMRYYSITVSAFALHHHPAGIVCACLFGAWLSVCLIQAVNVAVVVGVDVCLRFLGVVVECFHCFVILLLNLFSFSLRLSYIIDRLSNTLCRRQY